MIDTRRTAQHSGSKDGGSLTRSGALALAAASVVSLVLSAEALAARRPPKPPAAQGTFTDHLSVFDSARWTMADGWTNGAPFDNAWRADHVTFHDGWLDIRLDDVTGLGQPYSSGEYRTLGFYGYGCYEASFKPVPVAGVVTAFFTFAGPYDNGGNGKHNEIDIEFLGYDTTRVQLNFWANDDTYAAHNEALIDLGFDAASDFHRYGFKWTSGSIAWYIDGVRIYEAFDSVANPIPKATESLQKIMMNLWPVDETASGWAGAFVYPGEALHGYYDWVRYTAGEACTFDEPPTAPPPPPPGGGASAHVHEIAMSTDRRAMQAIARVNVVNGLGQPVAGATVTGVWSGIITSGDTVRTTDALGVATFYSARSKSPGAVEFCVESIATDGLDYDPGSNLETCDVIVK